MFIFGLGSGHRNNRVAAIARKLGAQLVNHTDPGCKCGYGCYRDECPNCKRHWFESPNLGAPFDTSIARQVMAAVKDL